MSMKDLIPKIEKARTKDDLEKLGINHLGIDVDKRNTKEVLRAQLLAEAETRLADETGGEPTPTDEHAKPEESAPTSEPEQAQGAEPAKSAPEKPAPAGKGARMARNTKTGRTMLWTAAMAKMSHMEQV